MAQRDNLIVHFAGETVALDTPVALAASLALQELPTVRRWNRLEGRPRGRALDQAIRAEIRDPLWNLSKQWQLGEFRGEDAASPSQASIHVEQRRLEQFAPGEGPLMPFDDRQPLEMRVERLPIAWAHGAEKLHLDLRLTLARRWRQLLESQGLEGHWPRFLERFPIAVPDISDPAQAGIVAHGRVRQRVAAFAGRALDGGDLYLFLTSNSANKVSDTVAGLGVDAPAVDLLGPPFVAWVAGLLNVPGEEANGWRDTRLEYAATVTSQRSAAPSRALDEDLRADEIHDGRLDWYHFDRVPSATSAAHEPLTEPPKVFIPATIAFDGMPHPRWWQFEEGAVSFGAIDPATSDLAKLLFLEHVLLYSNDWFVFPSRVRAGSLAVVRGLAVTNVFGERFWIKPTGHADAQDWKGWGLFTNSSTENVNDTRARHLTVLPTSGKIQDAEAREVQMLIRDEMANTVWAIEQSVRAPDGQVLRGAELGMETRDYFASRLPATANEPMATDARHRYELMTRVPEHWIPFIPVHKENDHRRTRLQRAAMPRVLEGGPLPPERVRPRTGLFREGLAETPRVPMFIEPEEVPRTGMQVFDGFRRTRWYGGQTFLWRSVQKRCGRGEGSSGLSFDQLVPKRPERPAEAAPPTHEGHSVQEVDPSAIPSVALVAHPDSGGGWNLEITTTNFRFAPEHASTHHIEGEGHLHLYVNGIKVTRVYSNWYHLRPLMPGRHQVTVELSANSHAPLAHEGRLLTVTATIDQGAVGSHTHAMGAEAVTASPPAIALTATEDPAGGYNLHMALENFTLSPASAGGAHVAGQGHLHLSVNGAPAARVYGEWHYLPRLGPGLHKLKAGLYTNDHRPYTKDGSPIFDEIEVGAGGPTAPGHGEDHH
jgi:hypothetical protein